MSIAALRWVARLPRMGKAPRAVLTVLADMANPECVCWPGNAHLRSRTDLSESTVRRAIRALEDLGYVDTDRADGRVSYYRLRIADPAAFEAAENPPGELAATPVTVTAPPVTVTAPPVTAPAPPVTVTPEPTTNPHSTSQDPREAVVASAAAAAPAARPQPRLPLLSVIAGGPLPGEPAAAPAKGARRPRSATADRAHVLPAGWEPSELDQAWANAQAEAKGVSAAWDLLDQVDNFTRYWHAEGGQKARKRDWSLTWRRWVDREIPFLQRRLRQERIDAEMDARRAALASGGAGTRTGGLRNG